MSKKLMPSAHSRHTGGGHPKSCPICNPRKSEKKRLIKLSGRKKVIDLTDLEVLSE